MTNQEILSAYQRWRTGNDDRTLDEIGITPAQITKSIDWAIKVCASANDLVCDMRNFIFCDDIDAGRAIKESWQSSGIQELIEENQQ